MFTQEELKALLEIINRVQFQGLEAEAVVALKQKILGSIQPTKEKDGK